MTDWQQQAIATGYRVFPVSIYYDKTASKWMKKPLIKDWVNQASADSATISAMRWDGANGFGIAMGGVGSVYALDVDTYKPNSEAEQWLHSHGLSGSTRTHKTVSGGTHRLYKLPPTLVLRNRQGIVPGLDARGHGGFIAFGEGYEVIDSSPPAMLSPTLCAELDRPSRRVPTQDDLDFVAAPLDAVLIAKVEALKGHDAAFNDALSAPQDDRSKALLVVARSLKRAGFSSQEFVTVVMELSDGPVGHVEDQGRNAMRALKRFWSMGGQSIAEMMATMPVVDADAVVTRYKQDQQAAKTALAMAALPAAEGDAALIREELCLLIGASPVMIDTRLKELKAEHGIGLGSMRTELAQLQRGAAGDSEEFDLSYSLSSTVLNLDFAKGRHLMFLQDDRYWRYDGRVWVRISSKQLTGFITRRAEAMLATGVMKLKDKGLAAVIADAERLMRGTVSRLDDPLKLSAPPPNVMNCTNCEICLDTWSVREHNPESYLRIALDVAYDPKAVAPAFERTMTDIMGNDQEMYRHLCEVIACIISPRKSFAAVVLLVGEGSNGKTLVLEVLNLLLGGAMWPCNLHKIDHNNFASNALVGKCAVVDDDLDYHTEFPISAVKKISEGKAMGGEAKGGEHFKFRCEVTPVCASNGFPPVRDTSFGFVRRANVIKFEQHYYLRNQAIEHLKTQGSNFSVDQAVQLGVLKLADDTLKDSLRSEASGILNVILLALQRLKERRSFDEPQAVVDARNEWRIAADSVQRFIKESSTIYKFPDASVSLQMFRERYRAWCEAGNGTAKGDRQMISALRSAGYTLTKTLGVTYLRDYKVTEVLQ
jgi:Bifunctional DNA primase/polymerase, N-terminal/D5 N terminal like/Family of unknown function (DUF5906)